MDYLGLELQLLETQLELREDPELLRQLGQRYPLDHQGRLIYPLPFQLPQQPGNDNPFFLPPPVTVATRKVPKKPPTNVMGPGVRIVGRRAPWAPLMAPRFPAKAAGPTAPTTPSTTTRRSSVKPPKAEKQSRRPAVFGKRPFPSKAARRSSVKPPKAEKQSRRPAVFGKRPFPSKAKTAAGHGKGFRARAGGTKKK